MVPDFIHVGSTGYFKYWCQKVLPAVYDDSLSYYELLCKVCNHLNEVVELTNTQSDAITELQELVKEFLEMDVDPYIEQLVDQWFIDNEPEIINDIESLEDALSALSDRVTDLENDVETIDARLLHRFYNKPGLFIGDSYSYGTGCSDHLSGDTKRFTTILSNLLGLSHEYNYAVGATGFVDPGNTPGVDNSFANQIERANNELSTAVKNSMGVVFICGGINDYNESDIVANDMRLAAAHCAAIAVQYFPNAEVIFVPMLWKGWGMSFKVLNFESNIYQGAINGGAKNVRVIMHGWTWFHGLTQAAHDSLHPNDTGHNQIARRICSALAGSDSYRNATFSWALESGYSFVTATNTNLPNNSCYMIDGKIQFGNTYIAADDALTANTATLIGVIQGGAVPAQNICGIIMHSNKFSGIYIITNTGNVYITPSESFSGNFFLQPVEYLPWGSSLL